jgi:hypothetical protein
LAASLTEHASSETGDIREMGYDNDERSQATHTIESTYMDRKASRLMRELSGIVVW